MDMQSNPSFYAIIPASVRYSDITPNAKLLYGEITALCSKEGYCWANNEYFTKLYKVNSRAVQRWIQSLKEAGFIRIEQTSEGRKLYLRGGRGGDKKDAGGVTKLSGGGDKKDTHITTESNTRIISCDEDVALEVSKPPKKPKIDLAAPIPNWAQYLDSMDNNPRRGINIIAMYFREKGLYFETYGKASTAITRHLRSATALAPFDDKEIMTAVKQAKKEYADFWTIETIIKLLTR